ncbi:phosphate acyltransferase [Desulfosporosinus fructosivorans]
MSGEFVNQILAKAKSDPKRVIFPESGEEKILKAAQQAFEMGMAYPIIVGNSVEVNAFAQNVGVSLDGFTIVDNTDEVLTSKMIEEYLKEGSDFSEKALNRKFRDPLNFAAALVKVGRADCLAAGVKYTTGDVILASQMIIGMKEGIKTVSSLGILNVPGFDGSEGNLLGITDCAVTVAPDSNQLAEIAISSADTVKELFGWEPRVAMLSFSTKGSGEHENVDKVVKAVEIANQLRPDLAIDGEFQFDSAIVPAVAAKKVKTESKVAGKANVVVFPDLDAGNIGVKIAQIFAKCSAHGPLLQGFAKPVTDFSRSAPIDEMLGAIAMVIVRAQNSR